MERGKGTDLVTCLCAYTYVHTHRFRFTHTAHGEVLENYATCWRASMLSPLWACCPPCIFAEESELCRLQLGFSCKKQEADAHDLHHRVNSSSTLTRGPLTWCFKKFLQCDVTAPYEGIKVWYILQHRYNLENIMLSEKKPGTKGEIFCVPKIGKFIETEREVTRCWGREEQSPV